MFNPLLTISPASAACGALACLVALSVWVYRLLNFRGLPSPPLSFEGHDVVPRRGETGEVYTEWFNKYSHTLALRVAPRYRPVILTADPGFASYVAHHVDEFEISSRLGKVFGETMGMRQCIAYVLGKDRRRVKRVYESTFSVSAVRGYFPDILGVVNRAKDKFKASSTNEIQPFEDLRRIMVDITQKVGLGEESNAVETGSTTEIETAIREWQQKRTAAVAPPRSLNNWFPKSPIPAAEHMDALKQVLNKAQAIGARKRAEVEKGYSDDDGWIAAFCRSTLDDVKASHRLSETEVAHNIPILFIASTDATVATLRMLLHSIATHPPVQEKLRKEIASLPENPTLDDLTGGYVDAVIEETLRMWQVYANVERTATKDCVVPLAYPITKGGKVINSVSIKKGDEIWISLSALNMDPDLYGHDVENFRPERWTDGSISARAEGMANTWGKSTGFWAGGRGCPVFNYPLACARALVFVLVRDFDISEPQGQVIKKYHGVRTYNVSGNEQFDFPIILTPRKTA